MTDTLIRMCGTRENNQVVFPEGLKITRIGKFRYGGRDYAKTRLFWAEKEEEAAVVPVGKEENNVEEKEEEITFSSEEEEEEFQDVMDFVPTLPAGQRKQQRELKRQPENLELVKDHTIPHV